MKNEEKKLSRYIDALNAGRKPKEHCKNIEDMEYVKLMNTVRRVRLLREPEYPKTDYHVRMVSALRGDIPLGHSKKETKYVMRIVMLSTAVAAAAAILFFAPKLSFPGGNTNIVYAMEQAFKEVKAYHGIIEVVETNELGETMTQASREVWADSEGNYYLREIEGTAKDIITVNNGELKWQLRPEEETSYLFTTFPDPYRFTFELEQEIEDVKTAQTLKKVGEETIAGRETIHLEITPEGGEPYQLWIDKETDLPLQRVSAMQNAIQYKVTYTTINFASEIPDQLLEYQLPEGYTEVDTNSEQIINTLEEAESVVDFPPTVVENIPDGYTLSKIAIQKEQALVKFYYVTENHRKTVVIQQFKVAGDLKPDSTAILGSVNNSRAEILVNEGVNSIRWQEANMEYSVFGNAAFEELELFVGGLTTGEVQIPSGISVKEPEIPVEVDLAVEENEQKSVDAGHSPWKLDPVFVAQVFASLLLSPEGIVGDYPISYEAIEMVENDGVKAIARINDDTSLAKYVYLERLVRQDETGIWTVVGYDKAE